MIYGFEGYMRDGMTLSVPSVVGIQECEVGKGMALVSVHLAQLEVSRNRNRRVICDFNPCRKYKHFDLKKFYEELEKRGEK